MLDSNGVRASLGLALVATICAAPAVSCSGASNSETEATAGQTSSSAGSSSSTAGSPGAGSPSSAGSSSHGGDASGGGTSGSGPQGGSSGALTTGGGPATGGGAGSCPTKQSWTEATHYVQQVTWPATLAAASGAGTLEIWTRAKLKATGNDVTGTIRGCGLILPEASFTAAGQLATGGQKLAILAPDSVWEGNSMPEAMLTGTQSSFDVGGSMQQTSVDLQGAKLADPNAAWPASGAQLQTFDYDDDTFPGWTATARTGGGYVLPPTAIGLVGSAPSADKVYNVSRVSMTIKGKRTACDAHSGPVDVKAFDYHVVGCHVVTGNKQCDATQTDFLDQNRMVYVVSSATYEAKTVPDGATCADVRAAFPHQ